MRIYIILRKMKNSMKEDVIAVEYSARGKEGKCNHFGSKTWKKETTWERRRRWQVDIKGKVVGWGQNSFRKIQLEIVV
jgi:hypothetical protein